MKQTFPFPEEAAHLASIRQRLEQAYLDAEADVARIDNAYTDLKRYMAQNRGELDPHEMFQNELGLRQMDKNGVFSAAMRDKIAKLKESPYFARIDFRARTDKSADAHYIGRFSFHHEEKLWIVDWRSPVASMFYDCEPGPAFYHAPAGKIEGELTRKRQFKITNGEMEYALESAVHMQDDVLQKELAHTSDEKMKSIIATIQKEQNQIIRHENAGTMIIQGVAGSGKTSIALHRIAFLLYRFKDRLGAKNVTIVSPNKVFGDYISNVLPELGEEPIYEVSLADIADVQLEGIVRFEAEKDPLCMQDMHSIERTRFKSTLDFVKRLDAFIRQIPALVFTPADYVFGRFTATADHLHTRFAALSKYPVKRRLEILADELLARFETENFMEEELPKSKTILKSLTRMLTVKSTMELYKAFYKLNSISHLFVMPAKKTLEWADVYPFLYIRAAFEGLQESSVIKHLVVDEMQDYTPVQYAVLNLLFPCQKTILGDFFQRVHPNHLHTLEDLRSVYSGAAYYELNKSYRSTYEIISFAKQIKKAGRIEAVERHGEPPSLIRTQNELEEIKLGIANFINSAYASLGILTKTDEDAKRLYDLLKNGHDVHLLSPNSTRFENGVTVSSVKMAKGLEFDEVMIPHANSDAYSTEYDRDLLYIACTRAMHKLTLLYAGEASPLLPA